MMNSFRDQASPTLVIYSFGEIPSRARTCFRLLAELPGMQV